MKLAVLGAQGRTARLFVELALQQGHDVRALVRKPSSLSNPRLVAQGDATSAADVEQLVKGVDAVVSTLGPVKGQLDVCSRATAHVIAAGVPRYVSVSGAGVDAPGAEKGFAGKLVSRLVKLVTPAEFADKERELALLLASDCGFTLVRPPRLTDGAPTGAYRVDLNRTPGTKLRRGDLAAFLLSCVSGGRHVRQAPFVAQ